ncbi:MAG TPA: hypothetical protein VFT51_04285 [Bacillales bacterium]|nr:hypothetical protein [Bacillales bacterium]
MEILAALAAVLFTAVLKAFLIKRHGQYLGLQKQKTRLKKGGQR